MELSDLTDKQLGTMISHYRSKGVAVGGRWPLSELVLEERRRTPSAFPPRDVAAAILKLSRESEDRLVSYHDIWKEFLPETEWRGNNPRRIMADALYRTIGYCVEKGLPVLTVLVVRKNERRLSPEAITHIYDECRELGLDVGHDPEAFVVKEKAKALQLGPEDVPSPSGER